MKCQKSKWYTYCLNNPLKYIDPSGFVALKSWDEFWQVVNNLMETGGTWNSETGYSDGRQGGGSGYDVPSGRGFQGPGQPYMLPEVTVTAKAPVRNTPSSSINNNPFISQNPSADEGWVTATKNINNGVGAAGIFAGAAELYIDNVAGQRITYTKFSGTRGWVSTPKVVSLAKNVGNSVLIVTSKYMTKIYSIG